MNLLGGLNGFQEKARGVLEGAGEQAETATKNAFVNSLPGAGLLFESTLENGFRLKTLGVIVLVGGLAYIVGSSGK